MMSKSKNWFDKEWETSEVHRGLHYVKILGYVVYLVKCAHTDIFGSNHTSKFLAHPTKLSLSLPARKRLFYSQSFS